MYLYNITIKVDWLIHDEWLHWMDAEHIAEILACKDFQTYKLYKILHIDDIDGPTYALQLFTESIAMYNNYIELHEQEIARIQHQCWGSQMLCFTTLMENVH